MRKHIQQVVGHKRGSCFATAIACVLDLDLEAVPNFVLFGDGTWATIFAVWCMDQHVHGRRAYKAEELPSGLPVIAEGPGPRFDPEGKRIHHAVVWLDGAMAHDPHPSGAGILKVSGWWVLERCPAGGCDSCGLLGMTRDDWHLAWRLFNEHKWAKENEKP